jgi:hypothetical protein
MPWEVLVRAYNPNDAARVFRDIQQERGITDHPTFCFVSLLHEPDEWEAGLVYESHGEPIRIELDWTD